MWILIGVTAALLVCDRVLKALARSEKLRYRGKLLQLTHLENPGFFLVTAGKQRYFMHPVESRTGAIRMEDNRAGAMWLQLANKSMLMNQAQGKRVADECATPEQKEFAAQMKVNPPENLLADTPKK